MIFTIFRLNIDSIYFDSNILNGRLLIHINSCFFVTVSNVILDNNILTTSSDELIEITGIGTSLTMSNISITNTDLLSSPAIHWEGNFGQIAMTQISGHNLKTDTDGSIVKIGLATILQASLFTFSNITSHDSDSSNNYMVLISAMDLTASFPSVLSNIIVSNSSTGILKIEAAIGDLNPDNMLIVQNLVMSDCNVTNSFDVISLSSMFTYDPYVIMFSNLTFQNLEFLQGANLLNLEHLLIIPVRIVNSVFENVKGGKISAKSFTTEIQGVSTSIDVSNVTVQNVNALYDSFFTLQTGAILTISDSFFSNMSCYEEGTVLYAGNE